MYQLELQGLEESKLEQLQQEFDMINNGEIDSYKTVYILGKAPAIFWKQWIDAGSEWSRVQHLTQLNNILCINSDLDLKVPPSMYKPLHSLIETVSGNQLCDLHASLNIIPNMMHEMVYVDDYNSDRYYY